MAPGWAHYRAMHAPPQVRDRGNRCVCSDQIGLDFRSSGQDGGEALLRLTIVKVVIAQSSAQRDAVVAVFDVRRAFFHPEEKRDTFVELLGIVLASMLFTHVGKLLKALYRTPPLAASWSCELEERACQLRSLLWLCPRNFTGSVAGVEHGDGIFVAGPRCETLKKAAQLERRWNKSDQVIGAHVGDRKGVPRNHFTCQGVGATPVETCHVTRCWRQYTLEQ